MSYTIATTGGQYIRESMRSAETREEAKETLREIGKYLGHGAHNPVTIETWDDGRIVLVGDDGLDVASAKKDEAQS